MKYYIVNDDYGKIVSAIQSVEPIDDPEHYNEVTEEAYNDILYTLGMDDDFDDMGMGGDSFV